MGALALADEVTRWRQVPKIAGRSAHTFRAYTNDLTAISGLLGDVYKNPADELPTVHLAGPSLRAAFAAFANVRAPATVARARSTWSGFLDVLVADGIIDGSPIAAVPPIKIPRGQPRSLRRWADGTVDELFASTVTTAARAPVNSHGWPERDLAVLRTQVLSLARTARIGAVQA